VATDYDAYFAENELFAFDQSLLDAWFPQPGVVVDLGCGTGRNLIALAHRAFPCLGVDLSLPMLRVVGQKAADGGLPVDRVAANMVELDCFRDAWADYALCMFSTLGMIRGAENRHRVIGHVRRILKLGGRFVLHVHNVWYNVFNPAGRRWLIRHLAARACGRRVDPGDKVFAYRGIPKMYLHTFTYRELTGLLRGAGFRVREIVPLAAGRAGPLSRPWLLGRVRANGWIVLAEKSS
jgi:ubiquinone/menaquinone biosynthesis C-methylase UbiE